MQTDSQVPKNKPTVLDKIDAGLLTRDEFESEVLDQIYGGLHKYCSIPTGYQHCELRTRDLDFNTLSDQNLKELLHNPPAEIVNPYPAHVRAIELFNLLLSGDELVCDGSDPLSPTIGAYLYGPPGSGKTHLMAAYARRIGLRLEQELSHVRIMLGDVIESAYKVYIERQSRESEANDDEVGYATVVGEEITSALSPTDEFWETIEMFLTHIQSYDYLPTDLIYIGFKELVELCKHSSERNDAMLALENARIVFIDDIHPQGDPEQIQIVLHLLERRYELGRSGTFLTTNLNTQELSGGDKMLGNRLLSRCAEMLITLDFSDCDDWRRKVKSRRVQIVETELDKRIQARSSLDAE